MKRTEIKTCRKDQTERTNVYTESAYFGFQYYTHSSDVKKITEQDRNKDNKTKQQYIEISDNVNKHNIKVGGVEKYGNQTHLLRKTMGVTECPSIKFRNYTKLDTKKNGLRKRPFSTICSSRKECNTGDYPTKNKLQKIESKVLERALLFNGLKIINLKPKCNYLEPVKKDDNTNERYGNVQKKKSYISTEHIQITSKFPERSITDINNSQRGDEDVKTTVKQDQKVCNDKSDIPTIHTLQTLESKNVKSPTFRSRECNEDISLKHENDSPKTTVNGVNLDENKKSDTSIIQTLQTTKCDGIKVEHHDCILTSIKENIKTVENEGRIILTKSKFPKTGNFSYRLLRENENGYSNLTSKYKFSKKTIEDHVLHGSQRGFKSKYISTSRSYPAVQELVKLKCKGNIDKIRIAKIDLNQLSEDSVIDLTVAKNRTKHLSIKRAKELANTWQEVLIIESVPLSAFEIIYEGPKQGCPNLDPTLNTM